MTTSRLGVLIESLAAGADIYAPSSSRSGATDEVNEMEFILAEAGDEAV